MAMWQLPQGISDLSLAQTQLLEQIRRQLIDVYHSWGYKLVITPMAEYEKSLSTSLGNDLKTFRLVDPDTNQLLAVRSDITPQIARLDAKYTKNNAVARFCYFESILKACADDFYDTRNPIQAGAELYGSDDLYSDLEIINIMLESLYVIGFKKNLLLHLGHTGIFEELTEKLVLSHEERMYLCNIFMRKSKPDLQEFLNKKPSQDANLLKNLIALEGDKQTLKKARELYGYSKKINTILDSLYALSEKLTHTRADIYFDLATPKSHAYYTGLLFACYHKNYNRPLAQGGRYSDLGERFGNNRSATGFSLDIKFLINASDVNYQIQKKTLFVAYIVDESLKKFIDTLRISGYIIVQTFDEATPSDFIKINNKWHIKKNEDD